MRPSSPIDLPVPVIGRSTTHNCTSLRELTLPFVRQVGHVAFEDRHHHVLMDADVSNLDDQSPRNIEREITCTPTMACFIVTLRDNCKQSDVGLTSANLTIITSLLSCLISRMSITAVERYGLHIQIKLFGAHSISFRDPELYLLPTPM